MTVFLSTLNQIAFLFGLIAIGYALAKLKVIPENSAEVLSKLENMLFIPALIVGTFIENFTIEQLGTASQLLTVSTIIAVCVIPLAMLFSKCITRELYMQRIYTYGLSFSNFAFMGNAVVSKMFPDIFFEYIVFTLPLWILIYIWGVPALLIADTEKKHTIGERLKTVVNPMFIAMVVGMVIGLLKIKLPGFIMTIISVSGSCMSPIAMILTGVVVSSISLKKTFTNVGIYVTSALRLLIIPIIFSIIFKFFNISQTMFICAVCTLSMPLGLNTIVIPSALGKDTSVAAGMAVISHILACVTIPIIFTFFIR